MTQNHKHSLVKRKLPTDGCIDAYSSETDLDFTDLIDIAKSSLLSERPPFTI